MRGGERTCGPRGGRRASLSPPFLRRGGAKRRGGDRSRSPCVRQEQLQQIVEETLPQIRWPDALVVAGDQPARLGFPQRLFCNRDLQARALDERIDRKAA